jgi:hypothetical protein
MVSADVRGLWRRVAAATCIGGVRSASSCRADARQHVGLLLYKMGMHKHYLFALARVPRWGRDQLERLNRVGVVPTFEKDRVPLAEGANGGALAIRRSDPSRGTSAAP